VRKRPPHAYAWGGLFSVAHRRFAVTLLTLYSTPDCHLCVEAREVLRRVQAELHFELLELDVTREEALHRAYFERIPVVVLGEEELFEYFVDEDALRRRLGSIL
jgi:glutaredoxin